MAGPVRRSAAHPSIKNLRRLLGRRNSRTESGRFVIEGPRLVFDAVSAGIEVELVVVPDDATGHQSATELATVCRAEMVAVDRSVFDAIADVVSPQPMLAVARVRNVAPGDVLAGDATVVLVGLSDPGNVGTVIRAAEAAGFTGVVVTAGSVDVWSPKVVRAAAGSSFRLPVAVGSTEEVLSVARDRGLSVLALDPRAGVAPETIDLTVPIVVLVGSEAHGLDDDVLARAHERIAIPMVGEVESLNAAVSAAVVMFERSRQIRSEIRVLGDSAPSHQRSGD